MAVSALSAARTVCELSGWTVTNLELQKILYIAQMIHLGETHRPLIHENFEAWEYGPVVPEVYRQVRGFGNGPVRNVFHWVNGVPENTSEYASLKEAVEITENLSASRLVSITHWDGGAWYQCYQDGVRRIEIPNKLIEAEFSARTKRPTPQPA